MNHFKLHSVDSLCAALIVVDLLHLHALVSDHYLLVEHA